MRDPAGSFAYGVMKAAGVLALVIASPIIWLLVKVHVLDGDGAWYLD